MAKEQMAKEQKVVRSRLGLLELAKQLSNVSQACKRMGYSRDSFYRFKELYDKGGEIALQEISQRRPVQRNRVAEEIETAVVAMAIEQPTFGRTRVANELKERGLTVSPSGVRRIWLHHDLETMTKRLKAVETKIAQDGGIPTGTQLTAREEAKTDKVAYGEFESEDPQAKLARITIDRSVVDPTPASGDKTVLPTGVASSDVALANDLKIKLLNDFETKLLNDLQELSSTFCSHPPLPPARARPPPSGANAADAALHPEPDHDASAASAPVVPPVGAAPVAHAGKPALQQERPAITVPPVSEKRAPAVSRPPAPLTNPLGQAAREKSALAKALLRLTTAAPAITDTAAAGPSYDPDDRAVKSPATASDPSSSASTADRASLHWPKAPEPQEDELPKVALGGGAAVEEAYDDERVPPEDLQAYDEYDGELASLRSHRRASLFIGAVLVAVVLAAGLTYMMARGERSVATTLITAADAAPAKIVPAAVPADNDQLKKLSRNLVNGAPSPDQAKLVTACEDKGAALPAASSGDDNNPISRVVEPAAPALDLPAKAGEVQASANHPTTDLAAGSGDSGQASPKKVRTFIVGPDMPVVASRTTADAGAGNLPAGASAAVPPSAAIFPVSAVVDPGWDAASGETQMDAVINGKVSPIAVSADPLGINGGAHKAAADPSAGAAAARGPSAEPRIVSASDASGGALMSDSAAAKTDASAVPAALARAQTLPHKRVVVANKAGKRLPTLPAIASSGNLY